MIRGGLAFVLFCYITSRLMTAPLGNSEFCFPQISVFPSNSSRETLLFSVNFVSASNLSVSLDFASGNIEILGKQNSLFPSGPVINNISFLYHSFMPNPLCARATEAQPREFISVCYVFIDTLMFDSIKNFSNSIVTTTDNRFCSLVLVYGSGMY